LHSKFFIKDIAFPRNITCTEFICKLENHIHATFVILIDKG
jgi:hypothetical protein